MSEQVGGSAHTGDDMWHHFHRGSDIHRQGAVGRGGGTGSLKKETNGYGL